MKFAACRGQDPEAWFPERGQSTVGNIAKNICFECPVRKQCDDYNKRTGPNEGIWAGKIQKRGPE